MKKPLFFLFFLFTIVYAPKVQSQDFSISVQSEPNKGATFYFDLTLKIKESLVIKEKPIESNTSYKNNTILVVDDNTINLMITKRLLESKQATVTTVENGADAIEKVKNETFDLILMDIHMPNMNGYTTTKTIRSFDLITPIIALTAVTLDDNEDKIFDAGMNDVVIKPFKQEDFYKKLNRFLAPY